MSRKADMMRNGSGWLQACAGFLARALLAETDRWFLWVPVLFGVGIGIYFALDQEPGSFVAVGGVVAAGGLALLSRGRPCAWACSMMLLLGALGFADAKLRSLMLATLMLERASGVVTVEGWVERAEPVLPKGYRLTIAVARLEGQVRPRDLRRVRVSSRFETAPPTGEFLRLRAILRPVPEPVMPGGFDFARKAWFAGIGAVGFAISEPVSSQPDGSLPGLWLRVKSRIDGIRRAVDQRIRSVWPGQTGAIASALITGERGRIPEAVLQALRHSGLAHVLAISGLHMVLMAGSLYWLVRAILAGIPALALRYPVKKVAALFALAGGGFYLALSGAAVATQRAYLMMAIMFLAVLLDRPALTMRNVALAATALLLLFPESLFDVSFQMSFAAALALVAVYERWSRNRAAVAAASMVARIRRKAVLYFSGVAVTTLVASIAVAPFAAYHFHKLAQFGLAANLAAMPLVGLVVMPMALAALLAMPLGLEYVPLKVMGQGIEGVVAIAEIVSGWHGAVIHVAAIPVFTLLALVIGGLWLVLWRERWRLAGLLVAGAGLAYSGQIDRPDMLISRDGDLVAVSDAEGTLSAVPGKSGRYSLQRWLAAYGDPRDIESARGASAFSCDDIACVASVRGKKVAFLLHPAAIGEECASADIVIARFPLGRRCKAARVSLDRMDLKKSGAHALYLDGQSIRLESVALRRGSRPWTRAVPPAPVIAETGDGRAHAADRQ